VVSALGFFDSSSGKGSNPTRTPAATARYTASIDTVRVVNPASVEVSATVRNIGGSSGTPTCTVRASDTSGAYSGWGIFDFDRSISAGGQDGFRGTIIITNEGASFVTDTEIECE